MCQAHLKALKEEQEGYGSHLPWALSGTVLEALGTHSFHSCNNFTKEICPFYKGGHWSQVVQLGVKLNKVCLMPNSFILSTYMAFLSPLLQGSGSCYWVSGRKVMWLWGLPQKADVEMTMLQAEFQDGPQDFPSVYTLCGPLPLNEGRTCDYDGMSVLWLGCIIWHVAKVKGFYRWVDFFF